jgi:peptide/nickel transport system ATP-binding protein/oligopeptide transport system ATP-binding protein
MTDSAVLEVKNLKTWFYTRSGIVKAVNGISYDVKPGECICLVGESGCGKSVSALSILRLFDSPPGRIVEGKIACGGVDLVSCSSDLLREMRGRDIAMVFQNAQSALNPVFTIGDQIVEQIKTHIKIDQKRALEKAALLLSEMRIPDATRALRMYPHQMSGGMRQRAMIAMSLSCDPKILIADEPTTAVDVTIRAQIMRILLELKRARNMSIIFITHDLSLVREIGDRAAVVYAGKVVEIAHVENIMKSPAHPYTTGLINCLPDISTTATRLPSIPGSTPSPIDIPAGCPFHPRCPRVMDVCRSVEPVSVHISSTQSVACHLYKDHREII